MIEGVFRSDIEWIRSGLKSLSFFNHNGGILISSDLNQHFFHTKKQSELNLG